MGRQQSAPQGEPLPPALEWHWTIQQIAVHHQMKPDAVIAAIDRGDLKAIKSGKDYRVPDSFYREWIGGSKVRPKPKLEGAAG